MTDRRLCPTGAQVAEELGASPMIIVTMGLITCVAGIALYLGVQALGMDRKPAMLAGIAVIAILRIAAIIKKIRLQEVRERG